MINCIHKNIKENKQMVHEITQKDLKDLHMKFTIFFLSFGQSLLLYFTWTCSSLILSLGMFMKPNAFLLVHEAL